MAATGENLHTNNIVAETSIPTTSTATTDLTNINLIDNNLLLNSNIIDTEAAFDISIESEKNCLSETFISDNTKNLIDIESLITNTCNTSDIGVNNHNNIDSIAILKINNTSETSGIVNNNYNINTNSGNMFSDVFEGKSSEMLKDQQTLEDSCAFPDGSEKNCMICKGSLNLPRVLSCLHVFCETCLNNLLIDETGDGKQVSESTIICPTCQQSTKLGKEGIASLICDYICTNILDLSSIESNLIACTSCKSKEQAISRCNDCANFLCAGCDNAHKHMRCFENHEVVKLEDLQNKISTEKVTIHKPLFCPVHASENLKYYCFNCQIPVCNDCLIADHKGSEHHYDLISAAEKTVRPDVENLIKEARAKVTYCDTAVMDLSSALTELQNQHDSARETIDETYKHFKAAIDKCRDQSIKDLERLHSERELKIMDLLHVVEKTIEKIDGVCKFTNRVLDQANAAEFLSMKKLIHSQFLNIIGNIPKCDINYSLEFDTKFEKFEQLAQETFGKFRTESTPPSPKESTPPPTLPGMPPMLMQRQNTLNTQQSVGSTSTSSGAPQVINTNGSSVTASSPISLPTSMQSSFDGDISGLGNGYMISSNMLNSDASTNMNHMNHHNGIMSGNGQHNNLVGMGCLGPAANSTLNSSTNSIAPIIGGNVMNNNNLGGFNSIAEYNLQRLANLAENTPDPTDPLVPTISSPNAPNQNFTLADILSGDPRAFNNFQALAKLGLNSNVDDFHTDLTSNHHLLTGNAGLRGQSPGIDSILNDFAGLGASASPMQQLLGTTDDLTLTNFQNNSNSGATSSGGSAAVPPRIKATPMQIRCKFGSLGQSKGQFNSPHGFCLGVDEEIIVADTNNHRIEVFEKNGAFKFQFGVPGKEEGQLWYPRKVAVMSTNGKFVVCDRGNERSRMQIFSKNGHFMKKIAIRYIDIVAGLAVTSKGQIVAVDSVSPTVFIISEDGDLVHWFDCSDFMREPSDIAIRDNDFYVCDFKGHCVVVFKEDGTFQYRIGNEKTTCFPNGIDISNAGDILIGDSHGNRFHVACFSRDGILQSEFECPHVKVSRCCGLKITSEGYVVTLAKNNHHVLVLNTLYVH